MRLAVVFLLLLFLGSAATGATLSEGRSAYNRNQVGEAERLYAAVAADASASAADRAGARIELARIAWLIDRDADRALRHLEEASRAGHRPCDPSSMKARVLRESGRYEEALREAGALLQACSEPAEIDQVRIYLIGARLDLAAREPAARSRLLAEAASEGAKLSLDAGVEGARVRLETALLTDDADRALAAWREYFWLEDSDAPQALADAGATGIFNGGLRKQATLAERLGLADLLMRTGFAVQSRRYADLHQLQRQASGDQRFKRLQAYWSVRQELESTLLRVNRRFAREGKDPELLKSAKGDLERAYTRWEAQLLSAAGAAGETSKVLERAYGLVGTGIGLTSGYPGLHLGHEVEDRELLIEQYGKSAKVHYQTVDNMLSNGFESWLWDGSAMVGGWQGGGVIVDVRPANVRAPLRAYAQLRGGSARQDLIARQRQRAQEDIAKLKARPVATLEGLSDRLQLQVLDRVAAVARTKSIDDASFRRAFLAEYSRARFDQSIHKHEGRHAIDEALGITAQVEQPVVEYEAKLSELGLSAYPRMALIGMNRNVEGEGPHDRAVAKLFGEYRQWMEAHTDQILGYDAAVPALAQLDKLTDGQIAEIARGIDPLPNGKPSPPRL